MEFDCDEGTIFPANEVPTHAQLQSISFSHLVACEDDDLFLSLEMGDSSTMRKGGKRREGDCYEFQGNPVNFMGQDSPPNLRGTNFSPLFTKPMNNASSVRKGKERDDDYYENQGNFGDFMGQDPPPNGPNLRGTDFNPPVFTQLMGNATTMRKGEKSRYDDCYKVHENSCDFMGQNPLPNPRGIKFSPFFFTQQMDNASTVRKGKKDRDYDCYEIQGNFDNFMGQDPPPNLRGMNFNPPFFTQLMDNASTMRKGGNTRNFDCYEIQGNSRDFIGQDPPPNSRGTNFSPRFFIQQTGNASTMRGGEKKRDDSYGMQGNSLNFLGQNPPPNQGGTNFTPLYYIHEDSVPDFVESRMEFEPPPSPEWSYHWPRSWDVPSWDDYDEPPMLPPLLAATDMYGTSARPHFATLNHVYFEQSPHRAAISSTARFQDKYVTVVLDKPTFG